MTPWHLQRQAGQDKGQVEVTGGSNAQQRCVTVCENADSHPVPVHVHENCCMHLRLPHGAYPATH